MPAFVTRRRVEFGDTDMAGIVHFSNFFRFMESAETDFLHSLGLSVTWVEDGIRFGFPRVSASCDYQRPAFFEDVLAVAVTVEKIGTKSVTYRFDFSRQTDPIATGRITAVFCSHRHGERMQSLEIPPEVRVKLETGMA